ncbi:MAG: hypothetical protein V4736_12270 [Bdellovibrionota bacterium]
MKKGIYLVLALGLIAMVPMSSNYERDVCEGFMEENDRQIPVDLKNPTGITFEEYTGVLDRIQKMYDPEVNAAGATLLIDRAWDSATVNATASRKGKVWKIAMYGGIARHPQMTRDGFAAVACHEMGHHVGGAPHKFFSWAANEGQSDYYAMLKCLRTFFAEDDNEIAITQQPINELAQNECMKEYAGRGEQLICIRSTQAGFALARVLQEMRKEKIVPDFATPDAKIAGSMVSSHPRTQCRLDTYFNGSRCPVPVTDAVSATEYQPGTCDKGDGVFTTGSRPRCWFKPKN